MVEAVVLEVAGQEESVERLMNSQAPQAAQGIHHLHHLHREIQVEMGGEF